MPRDYPQGIVAPLDTNYRLPSDILEAATMLLPAASQEEILWNSGVSDCVSSFDVSPAASEKIAATVIQSVLSQRCCEKTRDITVDNGLRFGESLLLSKGMQELDSTVLIHGLWDAREEAKFVASTIRRRSKKRRESLISAMKSLDDALSVATEEELLDLTDVAVMVRSSQQLFRVKEALANAGIPFVVDNEKGKPEYIEGEDVQAWIPPKRNRPTPTIPMKPATIMTMHRSKGEEFDDIYLVGWSEGEFPHPEAVSSSRVHEERRLAYVALTRARQRVVITHSFMRRVLHYGRTGSKRYVTSQVLPSRFLYELVPSKKNVDGITESPEDSEPSNAGLTRDNKGTVWKRDAGIKDYISGQNLPQYFQKSYKQPTGYVANRADLRRHTSININSIASCCAKVDDATKSVVKSQFSIGDEVTVINKTHKKYGVRGIVINLTNCFVCLREYATDTIVKIKPQSLGVGSEVVTTVSKFNVGDRVAVVDRTHNKFGMNGIVEKQTRCFVFFTDCATQESTRIKPIFLELFNARKTSP